VCTDPAVLEWREISILSLASAGFSRSGSVSTSFLKANGKSFSRASLQTFRKLALKAMVREKAMMSEDAGSIIANCVPIGIVPWPSCWAFIPNKLATKLRGKKMIVIVVKIMSE